MTGPQVPYPNATSTPAPVTTPITTTPPVGTQAPVAQPLAYPLPAQLAKEGTAEQQSAFEAAMVKAAADAGLTGTGAGGQLTPADILKILEAGTQGTTTVDPTVAQGQNAYEHIWGVTPPKGYIEGLVKAGFNVFQIQLHELHMPGANRTQYYRDNLASMAAQIAQLMGRR